MAWNDDWTTFLLRQTCLKVNWSNCLLLWFRSLFLGFFFIIQMKFLLSDKAKLTGCDDCFVILQAFNGFPSHFLDVEKVCCKIFTEVITLRDHPFRTYGNFSENQTFPTPWYTQEMLVFQKSLRMYKMDDHLLPSSFNIKLSFFLSRKNMFGVHS